MPRYLETFHYFKVSGIVLYICSFKSVWRYFQIYHAVEIQSLINTLIFYDKRYWCICYFCWFFLYANTSISGFFSKMGLSFNWLLWLSCHFHYISLSDHRSIFSLLSSAKTCQNSFLNFEPHTDTANHSSKGLALLILMVSEAPRLYYIQETNFC